MLLPERLKAETLHQEVTIFKFEIEFLRSQTDFAQRNYPLQLSLLRPCWACNGRGATSNGPNMHCGCRSGYEVDSGEPGTRDTCFDEDSCRIWHWCCACNGEGFRLRDEVVQYPISKDTFDGQIILLREMGHQGRGMDPGDIEIKIALKDEASCFQIEEDQAAE